MPFRSQNAFQSVKSTEPSFDVTFDSTAVLTKLESTGTGRVWQGPSGRSVRLSCSTAADYHVAFGSSLAVAVSTGSPLYLGGTVEGYRPRAGDTYISMVSSTTVTVNVTLGYGQ